VASAEEEYQQFIQIRAELEESNDTLRNMNRQLKDLAGVGKLIKSIDGEISKSFKEAQEFQKKSLGLGTNINSFSNKFSKGVDSLSSSLTGYGTALKVNFDLYAAGLRDNSTGMARLAAFTKMTGGNSAALAKSLGKSISGMQFSAEQQDELANRTVELSQRFGVSTDQLVGAIKSLAGQLDNLKALGLGDQAIEASQRLSAALGPAMAELGPQLLASFSKGNSMVQATLLGITNERRAFLAGSAEAGLKMVAKAGENAENIINRYINSGMDPAFALEKASQVYGQELVKAYNANQELRKQAERAGFKSIEAYLKSTEATKKVNEDFANTIESIRNRIFAPIQYATTMLMRFITAFLNLPIIGDLTVLVGQVVTSITALGIGILGVIAGFRKLVTGIIKLINTLTESVLSTKKSESSRDRLKQSIDRLKMALDSKRKGPSGTIDPTTGTLQSMDPRNAADQRRSQDIQRTANQQRALQVAKIGAIATSLGMIASVFGDNLPEWAQTSISYATTAATLVTAVSGLSGIFGGGGLGAGLGKVFSKIPGLGKLLGGGTAAAAAIPAAPVAPVGGGGLGAMGKGFKVFGEALKGFVGGMGKAIAEAFKFIGKGISYLGNPAVMKGAVSMILLATALVPLAGALNLMKGIKMATVKALGGALLVLGAAALGFGLLMKSGVGAVAIFLGAAAIAALGAALIPLAYAATLASPGLESLADVLYLINPSAALGMLMLGPALVGIAAGLVALTAGSMFAKISAFFGADPFEALYKLGEAATPIIELANSLGLIPKATAPIAEAFESLNDVRLDGFKKQVDDIDLGAFAESLKGLDRNTLFSKMMDLKLGAAESMVESDGFKGTISRKNALGQTVNDQYDFDHVNSAAQIENLKATIAQLEMAKQTESTRDDEFVKDKLRMQLQVYNAMVRIEQYLAQGNDQREVGNQTRYRQLEDGSRDRTRPTAYASGRVTPDEAL
jgi:hypothetical protein